MYSIITCEYIYPQRLKYMANSQESEKVGRPLTIATIQTISLRYMWYLD